MSNIFYKIYMLLTKQPQPAFRIFGKSDAQERDTQEVGLRLAGIFFVCYRMLFLIDLL